MQFDVLDSQMDEIKDPESGEVIGVLNRPKVRVQVSFVGERFAVAQTFRKERVNIGGSRGFGFDRTSWSLPIGWCGARL